MSTEPQVNGHGVLISDHLPEEEQKDTPTNLDGIVRPVPSFNDFWNLDFVVIQAQGMLFNVPRQILDVPGTTFGDMFTVPPGEGSACEGQSQESPIVLDDSVTAYDFDAFLRKLLSPFKNPVATYDEYLGVLRLAHKWNYDEIRENIIDIMCPLLAGYDHAATKVHLGKQFLVQSWLLDGLTEIASKFDFSLDELDKAPFNFSQVYISKIFFIQKEHMRISELKAKSICAYCMKGYSRYNSCRNSDCSSYQHAWEPLTILERVQTVFSAELTEAEFRQSSTDESK